MTKQKSDIQIFLADNELDLLKLIRDLNGIMPEQLNDIISKLKPPDGIIPPFPAAQGQRVDPLLRWADAPRGCRLNKIQQTLIRVISPFTDLIDTIEKAIKTGEFCYIFSHKIDNRNNISQDIKDYFNSDEFTCKLVSIIRPENVSDETSECYLNDLDKVISELAEGDTDEKLLIIFDFIEIENSLENDHKSEFRDSLWLVLQSIYEKKLNNEYKNVSLIFIDTPSTKESRDNEQIILGWQISFKDSSEPQGIPIIFYEILDHLQIQDGQRVLNRIWYWTNGHPYLTQQLCELFCSTHDSEAENREKSKYDVDIDKLVQNEIIQLYKK